MGRKGSSMGDTAVNLEAAAAGEYVEVEPEKRYRILLSLLENGTLFKREKPIRWKCLKCGRIHEGIEAPKVCATCLHPQGWYVPAEENY